MREYMLFEAHSRQAYGRFTGVVRLFNNWKQRNDLRRLLAMDDHVLTDIGLRREVLERLARRSILIDWEFERERQDFKQ